MLTTIITNVIIWLLGAIGGWAAKYFHAIQQDKKEEAKDNAETAAARAALEAARTKQEMDDAAKRIADSFGG